jgi:very-short-patch-repair endonuclease
MIGLKILERWGLYRPLDYERKRFERLGKLCESPMECAFWSAAYYELSKYGRLTPQLEVGPYRLDFALQGGDLKVAIEIDGHEHHKTKDQRAADYKREHYLQKCGWFIIRFTGSSVYKDAQWSVSEVIWILRGLK